MKWNPKAEARIVACLVAALVGAASALLLASCAEVIEAERETARVGGGLTALATDTTAAKHPGRSACSPHVRLYGRLPVCEGRFGVLGRQVAVLYPACLRRILPCWPRWNLPIHASFS